jgi:hypothetical protein
MRVVYICATMALGLILGLPSSRATAQEANTAPPLFTATPTVLLRSPDPTKLAEFYLALGMKEGRRNEFGVIIYLENGQGSLEILKMDPNTKPGGPKTTRKQQGVVAIFEVTDQVELVRRAKEAGATLVERWTSSERGHSIYYVGDWENNIFGFTPRYHNPKIKVP